MRLEHAFLPEMREELASRDVLHKHVEMPRALGESIEVDLSNASLTMKGWVTQLRMRY